MRKGSLGSLNWISRFTDETPGDNQIGGLPRQVPGVCWSRVNPTPTPNPVLRIWSTEMAEKLGLEAKENDMLGGKKLSSGMHPYAQRYGGHQFGNWAGQLGDGRAITLGEVDTGEEILELQLKGSGVTPYSRFSDGKAVLRSSIREFLCSEAMHHLCVPTTRALSLVTTGEDVVRDILYDGRPAAEPGAIVCRVAPSFIRFGSFQIHSMSGDLGTLRSLVDYTVKHHFPGHNIQTDDGIIEWLKHIADETALMIAHWMRIGFVHGVMNTDNMSIHGLTIDYGPYGWLEDFNPDWTPNTTDSGRKRYKFGNQAQIGGWNYARLLESMAPLLEQPNKLHKALDYYYETYQNYNNEMWAEKLGLDGFNIGDDILISELTALLQSVET
ncbi:MAG TPA: YdiU family protein, partial [Bacteroidetes bacterium]|nr:YdiU family protein [Bacteroidota bacterium]